MKTAQITLTPEELLSLAPEVRAKFRDAVTPRRAATTQAAVPPRKASIEEVPDEEFVSAAAEDLWTEKEGDFYMEDPIEMYLNGVGDADDSDDDCLIVARESHALRSIDGLIANRVAIECLLDPESQVIAMLEEVCHFLELHYTPDIKIRLQSANRQYSESLGLARNLPVRFGNMTIYLQIHIVRGVAYDILLGRPFDVLTESVVRNYANADQTVTMINPNGGATLTLPTFPRGHHLFRDEQVKQQRA
ncbi:hypothetical protein FA95DRAFT_1505256 [Auriscalpium vulgare]|uniref:Uncharacterized protein n=1 Tax=Auriscalpium vulgare TaxID=40419 RepID=A0ACB8R3H7_9AGAM|nr:hypothetical protein FA95DRAFT_1505256 [Auriscalpium vulgare]